VTSGGSLLRLDDLQPSLEEVYTAYFEQARNAA
jgi:ABC-2 type transport system ATP-binding protein